jgi:hypothetical protein
MQVECALAVCPRFLNACKCKGNHVDVQRQRSSRGSHAREASSI